MSETTEAPTPTPGGLLDRYEWTGYLTVDNADEVLRRVNRMLVGKHYTFVTQHHYVNSDGAHDPVVRTGNQLLGPGSIWRSSFHGSPDMVHLHLDDGDYSWGLDTSCPTEVEAFAAVSRYLGRPRSPKARADYQRLAKLVFRGDLSLQITQYNGAGARLVWVIAVEDHTDYQSEVPQDDQPVVGEAPDSIAVRVGPMDGLRYEGAPGVQVTHRLGTAGTNVHVFRLAMVDPDQVEAHARELLVAARQMREERARRSTRP